MSRFQIPKTISVLIGLAGALLSVPTLCAADETSPVVSYPAQENQTEPPHGTTGAELEAEFLKLTAEEAEPPIPSERWQLGISFDYELKNPYLDVQGMGLNLNWVPFPSAPEFSIGIEGTEYRSHLPALAPAAPPEGAAAPAESLLGKLNLTRSAGEKVRMKASFGLGGIRYDQAPWDRAISVAGGAEFWFAKQVGVALSCIEFFETPFSTDAISRTLLNGELIFRF